MASINALVINILQANEIHNQSNLFKQPISFDDAIINTVGKKKLTTITHVQS